MPKPKERTFKIEATATYNQEGAAAVPADRRGPDAARAFLQLHGLPQTHGNLQWMLTQYGDEILADLGWSGEDAKRARLAQLKAEQEKIEAQLKKPPKKDEPPAASKPTPTKN